MESMRRPPANRCSPRRKMQLLLSFASFLALSGLFLPGDAGQRSYSQREAEKVLQAIERVQKESLHQNPGRLRQISLTESELNSYIAYRIETEKEEIMKELRLKLFDENKIEGKIHIDLKGQNVPQFVQPEMDFYFAADLLTSNGSARVEIRQLFLENQPIQPYLLDLVMAISARLSNQEATSLNDWYELPFGIKDIKTKKGKAIFYY